MIHIETVLDDQIFQQTDGFADIPVRSTVRFEEKNAGKHVQRFL